MRISSFIVLSLSLTACTDKPSDTGTGTDTDTDTTPTAEDCGDGIDNDDNGLVDCEDTACLDACVEDCGDGVDNDLDGATDCDDDECTGASECPVTYTMSMETVFTEFPDYNYAIYASWGGDLSARYGQGAIVAAHGYTVITATADGAAGFSCTGDLYLSSYGSGVLGDQGMSYVGGGDGVVDYRFSASFQPGDGLTWRKDCPIASIPIAYWGFYADPQGNSIARSEDGVVWSEQYSAAVTSAFYYTETTIHGFRYLSQAAPVTWTAAY